MAFIASDVTGVHKTHLNCRTEGYSHDVIDDQSNIQRSD